MSHSQSIKPKKLENPDYALLARAQAAVEIYMPYFRLPGNQLIGTLEGRNHHETMLLNAHKQRIADLAALTPFFKSVPLKDAVDEFIDVIGIEDRLAKQVSRSLTESLLNVAAKEAGIQSRSI